MAICTHLDQIAAVTPSSTGCEDCRDHTIWLTAREANTLGKAIDRQASLNSSCDLILISSFCGSACWYWASPRQVSTGDRLGPRPAKLVSAGVVTGSAVRPQSSAAILQDVLQEGGTVPVLLTGEAR